MTDHQFLVQIFFLIQIAIYFGVLNHFHQQQLFNDWLTRAAMAFALTAWFTVAMYLIAKAN